MLTMLIINNLKSFKNRTIIDFTKTNYKVLEESNVADNNILKSLMFVGANASGKSNILFAIRLLLDLLFKGSEVKSGFLKCLFSNKSEFSIDYKFMIEKREVHFYFEYDDKKTMISEKLYVDNKLLLERIGTNAKTFITESKNFDGVGKKLLFLRTIYINNEYSSNATLLKWFEFLKNSVYINAFDCQTVFYSNQDFSLYKYIEEQGTEAINQFFIDYNFDQTIEYENEVKCNGIVIRLDNKNDKIVFIKRRNTEAPIPINEECLGNRILLSLLPLFLHITKHNGMLLIDEFSIGFHNELESLLVKYFMENSKKSQMIFVSHSTNLLSTSLLRPDQIYSVSFDAQSGSYLKRFSEEQPRVAQNLEKMYLGGVFGGLPEYSKM